MLFLVHLTLWFNFRFLWASRIEANVSNSAVCQNFLYVGNFFDPEWDDITVEDIEEKSRCLLYPTNVLNCSWSLEHLLAAQILPHISICDRETQLQSRNWSTEERVGSASFILQNIDVLYVVLQFNISLQGNWTVYTNINDKHHLEVPPPPGKISTSLRDENLLVTWSLPKTRVSFKPSCFKYQLDIGYGEPFINIPENLSYTVPNVDPSLTYRVRMRVNLSVICQQAAHSSEWSPVLVVEPSVYPLSLLVIVLMLLGIPMILLALLLLVRYQRVCKTIFPPIPRPPPKYMYFLEKNDGINIHHPCTPVEQEVITAVLYE